MPAPSRFSRLKSRNSSQRRLFAAERLEDRLALSNVPLAPVAMDDDYSVDEDTVLSGSVLAGDIAAKAGQSLRIAEVNGQAIGDGTSLILTSGATLSVDANGSFSYDPTQAVGLQSLDDGEQALDQFTYTAAPQFSNIFVFGDSLSDQGQLFDLTGGAFPPQPPYFQGRFSNGPVWIEGAAPRLGLSTSLENNFAFGGATSGTDNYNDALLGADLPGVTDELNGFLQGLGGQAADPEALYVVWAGSNDFFLDLSDPSAVITDAVTNIANIVGTLEAFGAQHVLVMNLPDLGQTPYGISSGLAPQLTYLTQTFNSALSGTLDLLGLDATQIDVFSRFQQIVADPAAFGLTNVTVAAFDGAGVVADPATSLFWDSVHPTAAGHALIADLVFEKLTDEAVASIDVEGITTTPNLQVENLPGPAAGDLRLRLSASDPAANDQAAGLQYLVDWGDGSAPAVVNSSGSIELTHSFASTAVAQITIRVIDQDGDSSTLREAVLWGTKKADLIEVRQGASGQINLLRNGNLLSSLSAENVDRVVAFGLGGNDLLSALTSSVPVEFDGGQGNDWLVGGHADDILRGGSGNDILFGMGGDDSLSGGSGIDLLFGADDNAFTSNTTLRKKLQARFRR